MILQWLPRARTGGATTVVGDVRDVRRSAPRAGSGAGAGPAAAIDDDLDAGWSAGLGLRVAHPDYAAEDSRLNPALVGQTSWVGRKRELKPTARRLKAKDASAADVLIRDAAFRWGDAQWAKWHLDNDSSDDEDEEMGEFDPFSEENVPSPKRRNRKAIHDLFEQRYNKKVPTRGHSQSKLFDDLLGFLRACIIRNVYPLLEVVNKI